MARRRKKSKAAAAAKAREKESSPMITEKSLPALPPNAIPMNAFSNDRVDPDSDTPTELSPRPPRGNRGRSESSSRSNSRPAPPRSPDRKMEGYNLPASTYRNNRNSTMMPRSDNKSVDNGDGFLISVALDPSPRPTPRSTETPVEASGKSKEKDYFNSKSTTSEKRSDSLTSTPHIAFQEKGRQASLDHDTPPKVPSRRLSKSSKTDHGRGSPATDEKSQKGPGRLQPAPEDFRLQDAPKTKKTAPSRSSSQSSGVPVENSPPNGTLRKDGQAGLSDPTETTPPSRTSHDSRPHDDDEVRASTDSSKPRLDSAKPITRKELPSTAARNGIAPEIGPLVSQYSKLIRDL